MFLGIDDTVILTTVDGDWFSLDILSILKQIRYEPPQFTHDKMVLITLGDESGVGPVNKLFDVFTVNVTRKIVSL